MNSVAVANQEEAASVAAEFLSSESISPLFPIVCPSLHVSLPTGKVLSLRPFNFRRSPLSRFVGSKSTLGASHGKGRVLAGGCYCSREAL